MKLVYICLILTSMAVTNPRIGSQVMLRQTFYNINNLCNLQKNNFYETIKYVQARLSPTLE
jgi:hypothetical protein